MFRAQEFIHRLEEGPFSRIIQFGFVALLIAGVAVVFNVRAFHNLNTADGMQAAQLARNLAEGRGYVTDSISPFSMYLVKERQDELIARKAAAGIAVHPEDYMDQMKLRNNHPDISQAPLYPLVLSWFMRLLPFDHEIDLSAPFGRYQPDQLIAIVNQLLLIASALMVFALGRRWFDNLVAWFSMLLFVGTDFYWQFSLSGNSTLLLLLLFLCLLWLLTRLDQGLASENWSNGKISGFGVLIGLTLGLGFLTRYAFGWLLLPVLVFLILTGRERRFRLVLLTLLMVFLTATPWVSRNLRTSGTPFGTAGFAVHQLTQPFPGDELPRSLHPDLDNIGLPDYVRKFKTNALELFREGLPTLGGTWMTAFFFVGLLVVFQSATLNRMRGFMLMVLGLFFVVQALGKTQLSIDSPTYNSENLLALLGPPVILFGVSLFFMLLDQWNVPEAGVRVMLTGMFGLLISLPLIFTLVSRSAPAAYPPYFPPVYKYTGQWLRPSEQMMSDIPAAIAWYGNRQCLLWTLDPGDDFYAIYDYQKPISALYLSPKALDAPFLSGLLKGPGSAWGRPFLVNAIARVEIPREFPLKFAPPLYFLPEDPANPNETLPEQLFLADRIRW